MYEREDSFAESPLNMLVLTGALKRLNTLKYEDGTVITGFDYFSPIEKVVPTPGIYNVCVAHQYYNVPLYKEYITPEQALAWGYNAYVLGHDHSVYEPVQNDKYTVIRNGSITRGTSNTANLMRDVYVTVFDTTTKTFEKVQFPVAPADEVFKEIKFIEKSLNNNVEDIIDKLEFNAGESIYDMLDKQQIPDNVKKLIEQYLYEHGIIRKTTAE